MIAVTYRSHTLGVHVSVIIDANEPCMRALGALTTVTYFCLNTVQSIHIVVYSECFIMDVYVHMAIRRNTDTIACSDRGTYSLMTSSICL